jgi:hypothetical protein
MAVALGLAMLAGAACARRPPHVGTLDRLDVALEVRPDGSVDVREDLTAGTGIPAGAALDRSIEPVEADSVALVSTSLDGAFSEGRPDGVTVDAPGARMAVHWQVPADRTRAHTLTIRYKAFNALRVLDESSRASLRWLALSPDRGYDIAASRLTLVLPSGVRIYEGTGIGEAGWTVERTTTGITATRASVPDADAAFVFAEFDLLRATMAESAWQVREHRQENLLPAYVSAALFMFVIGAGALFILRKQYPRRQPGAPADAAHAPRPDPEKLMVARNLRITAWVGGVVAIACGIVAFMAFREWGDWLQLIPGSMLIVGAVFLVAARWWERDARR